MPSGSWCAWSAVSEVWWLAKSIDRYHIVPSWKPWYGASETGTVMTSAWSSSSS